ncbi:acyltransferase family protein [Acinetobacter piscicola]|uniref:acyltransferase family protein n=1 Tax=Acinetobacter piscicola TaxID=2006115 RepID=UPI00355835AE
MDKRIDIQLLRALAVIFVVLFHLEIAGIESGFLGVDVFFVVSGFLMAILYKKGEAKKFFERRAKRLVPAYFAIIILTLIASLFLVLPSELGQVATQSIYGLFFANNIGFWMQNSYFSKSDFNPLLHLWSLGVEIQFYLIVPLLAWFFRKSKIFLFLAILGSFAACVFIVGISTKTSFFMMPLRMWEFLIGFVVAFYFTNNGSVKFNNFRWLGLIGLIILCAIPFIHVDGQTLNRLQGHPSFYALFVCVATSLVLGFGLPKVLENNVISNGIAKIGDYSYSIYLVHFPIIVLYLYEPFSGTKLYPESYVDKGILLVLIIVASILMHKLIETRRFNNIAAAYLVSLVSIFVLTGATKVVPNMMYSERDKNIFNGLEDRAPYRCGKLVRITDPKAISCKINAEHFDQSILLVGNSHADSIKIAFSEVASQHKLNTYFLVSNTPLMDASVTPERLINEAKSLKINHLVLHFSPKALKIETIEKVVDLAQQNNMKVDFILPVPTYTESVPKIIYQNNLAAHYDIKKYQSDNAEFFAQMEALKSKYSNLQTHEVSQIFCNTECIVSDDAKHPYYFDDDHLNLTGAKLLKPVFEKVM